jgi:hypothetical protein
MAGSWSLKKTGGFVVAVVLGAAALLFDWGCGSGVPLDDTATDPALMAEEEALTAAPAPSAARIHVVDLRSDLLSGAVNNAFEASILSFQGLVNRGAPRLFVIRNDTDRIWLDEIRAAFPAYQIITLASSWDAFAKAELKALVAPRMILYRASDSPLAVNNALSAAGVVGAVAVEESNRARFEGLGYTAAAEFGDLRGLFSPGNPKAAQNWGLTNLRPRTIEGMYCASLGDVRPSAPHLNGAIDYCVSRRMFVFMLATKPEYVEGVDTVSTQRKVLETYPRRAIAFGWWGKEPTDIRTMSEYGHSFMIGAGNHSLHVHLGRGAPPAQPKMALPEYRPRRAYVTFIVTQSSEALGYLQRVVHGLWTAPSQVQPGVLMRDRVPFTVMYSALQLHFQPLVAHYLATHQGAKQTLIDKGYGYANPSQMTQADRRAWLSRAKVQLEQAKIKDWIINDTGYTRAHFEEAAERLGVRSIFTINGDLSGSPEDDPPFTYKGVAIFPDPVDTRQAADESIHIQYTINAIKASAKHRQFIVVKLPYGIDPATLESLADRLTEACPKVTLLSADAFVRLYKANGDSGSADL